VTVANTLAFHYLTKAEGVKVRINGGGRRKDARAERTKIERIEEEEGSRFEKVKCEVNEVKLGVALCAQYFGGVLAV
jgi:hypothetical protein